MRVRYKRAGALVMVLALLVVAACGQKPNIQQQYAGPGGLGVGAGDPGSVGADGQPIDPGAGTSGDGTAGAPGSDPGSVGAGGTADAPGAGSGGTNAPGQNNPKNANSPKAPPGGPVPDANDKNGITPKEIHVGIHAPVTGAAAFPQRSFENGVGVYADYINSKGGINGRKLVMHFEDDAFNPNTARNKCKSLAEQKKVFLIIGGAGSDQIDACARYAHTANIPYISGGVHETRPNAGPLASLRTYYAASLSYEQQSPMIARQAKAAVSGASVGLLVANNDSLNNYYGRQLGALQSTVGKSKVVLAERVPKNLGGSDAQTYASRICAAVRSKGMKAVVWNASPSGLINVATAMKAEAGCDVQFIGPGNTNGINIVAQGGCPEVNRAQYFGTYPQLDKIRSMDPAFWGAYQKKNGGANPDDIGVIIWGIEKLIGQMLQAAGKDLGRAKFMATLNSGKTFNNGVMPAVKFGANKRLGGTAMHLLEAQCASNPQDSKFITKRLNVRP